MNKDLSPELLKKIEQHEEKFIEKLEKKKSIKDRLGDKISNDNDNDNLPGIESPTIINNDRKVFVLKRVEKIRIEPVKMLDLLENMNTKIDNTTDILGLNQANNDDKNHETIELNITKRKRDDDDDKKEKRKTHRHSDKKRKKEHRSRSKSKERKKKKDKKHKKDKHKSHDKKIKQKDIIEQTETPIVGDKQEIDSSTVDSLLKLPRKNPRPITDRDRITLDEATFEPDYSASDAELESKELGIELKISKQEEQQLDLQIPPREPELITPQCKINKIASTDDDSSAVSSSESESSDDSHKKHKKKHKKHRKRKTAKKDSSTDSDSDTDDTDSSSDEEKHRKKTKKSKSSKSKHSKSKKKKSKHK